MKSFSDLLKLCYEHLPLVVIVVHKKSVLYANPLCLYYLGYSENETVQGLSIVDILIVGEHRESSAMPGHDFFDPGTYVTCIGKNNTRLRAVLQISKLYYDKEFYSVYSLDFKKKIDRDFIILQNNRLSYTLEATVRALGAAVEIKDPYTSGHQQRTASLAVAIAGDMGLLASDMYGINIAASLHDIGKINIPSDILNKPGRLNKIEMQLIRMHVKTGFDILKDIPFPWPVAETMLQHHERLDGSGYPNGLTEKEMSIAGKIISVADAVEAMASHRPYRAARSLDDALGEIKSGAGRLYDSEVVRTCIGLFRRNAFCFGDERLGIG